MRERKLQCARGTPPPNTARSIATTTRTPPSAPSMLRVVVSAAAVLAVPVSVPAFRPCCRLCFLSFLCCVYRLCAFSVSSVSAVCACARNRLSESSESPIPVTVAATQHTHSHSPRLHAASTGRVGLGWCQPSLPAVSADNNLCIKHRHLQCNLLCTIQYIKAIPPVLRRNLDIFVIFEIC